MKNIIISTIMMAWMVSCSVGPTARLADGSMITTGGSLLTSGQADARQATHPNGLALNWIRTNYEETSVAKTAIGAWGLAKLGSQALAAKQSTNATTVATAKEGTKQAGIAADAATAQKALGTPAVIPGAAITAPGVSIVPPATP